MRLLRSRTLGFYCFYKHVNRSGSIHYLFNRNQNHRHSAIDFKTNKSFHVFTSALCGIQQRKQQPIIFIIVIHLSNELIELIATRINDHPMKQLLFGFVALIFFCPAQAQNPYETPQLKEDIKRLDLAHAKAIFTSDALALDSLMDNDVTVNHPANKIVKEKKELLSLIKQGTIRYTAFERSPETFLFFKDVVVVMGTETVVPAASAPNAGKTIQRRYTNVWMKKSNQWKLCVRHANNVCQTL